MQTRALLQTHNARRAITPLRLRIAALLPLLFAPVCHAWGPDGHAIVNRLAAENLPASVPAFLRAPAAIDDLVYYSSEPDRWRSSAEPELNAAQAPEHFIRLELADLAGPLPRRRYDFIRALAAAQPAHTGLDLSPEHVGLQPYVTSEVYERLQSALRDYRGLQTTHQSTRAVEREIVFLAGWLGHYVADGCQPMHTSVQYDGWIGPNPNNYTTRPGVHWAFENDFVHAAIREQDVAPLVAAAPVTPIDDVFASYLNYLRHTATFVDQTYRLEKSGAFNGRGTPEGRAFTARRLAAGADELRDLIYTAWIKSADPVTSAY
jgi:hypothetical protein